MKPDPLFVSVGGAALCAAAYLALSPRPQRSWIVPLCWAILGAGLLVQGFAPRLKIERNAFVMPPSLLSGGKAVHPAEIVARERAMQALSGILTAGGALGLAFCYRRVLVKPRSPAR